MRIPRLCLLLLLACRSWSAAPAVPVTPHASVEAVALLEMLRGLSGRYTLTGQHNYPATLARNSEFAAQYTGKTPVIFGSDWGHAKAGDYDSYLARPDIVQEAIRQHRMGAVVALCWHAVPPTADEPVTFRKLTGSDPNRLTSVQGALLDSQFREVLTPGTALHAKWCAQVDAVAVFLRQLEQAHVPVLWRPYHEMNGDWFWWGGRAGPEGTAALYRQIFDRLVNHHHLTNLVWVWSVDRPGQHALDHDKVFPGIDCVDVLALDVYGNDFAKAYYDSLVGLSQGKPIALAEVGNPPSPEILRDQPKWAYYMTWAGMVRNTPHRQYDSFFSDPRYLGLEDPAYGTASAAYRQACGLPVLGLDVSGPRYSGTWALDEDRSDFGPMGASGSASLLEVVQDSQKVSVRSTRTTEYGDSQVSEDVVRLDGTETTSLFMGRPRVSKGALSPTDGGLVIEWSSEAPWAGPGVRMTVHESWRLLAGGKTLRIERTASPSRQPGASVLYYARK